MALAGLLLGDLLGAGDGQETEFCREIVGSFYPLVHSAGRTDDASFIHQEGDAGTAEGVATSRQKDRVAVFLMVRLATHRTRQQVFHNV